jgi:uncharacterized protein
MQRVQNTVISPIGNLFLSKKIPPQSWIDARIEVRPSSIHGKGMFANATIQKGEVVIVWGGTLFTLEEILAGKALEHSYTAVADGVFLGHTREHGYSADDYMNHSCDPCIWFADEITLVARRLIRAGDEVTADIAMFWGPDEKEKKTWKCCCGSAPCRKVVTSEDWRRIDLHERYGHHFSPYISENIERLNKATPDDPIRSMLRRSPVDFATNSARLK